ncbi:hypothetical protein IUY40_16295 [Flavobacterium sp. ALJ2]|uniref:hypothetical protein n=1 Tax=Flavobacterium sp. ALJ2 TaxID=2786960 RepID=UPI00189F7EE4|nr:hypothetical protein [Flavobacterium sp. ALJ2]MBF7093093.1 hypothetical protein [Flavobacterium sp. ALJ2]
MDLKDNLILVTEDGTSINIAFFEFSLINEKNKHYSGNIILHKERVPKKLQELLTEQEKLVTEGSFLLVDQIGEEINKFNIFIETSNLKIYDLYIENGEGDFKIY